MKKNGSRPALPFVPVRYFEVLVRLLGERGIPSSAMLAETTVTETILAEQDAYLTLDQVEALVLRAAEFSTVDDIALEVGLRFLQPSHGAIGIAAMTAKDMMAAIAVSLEYLPFTLPLFEAEIDSESAPRRIRLHPRFPLDARVERFLRVALSASFYAHTAFLLGGAASVGIELDAMHSRPAVMPPWIERAGIPVRFDQPAYEIRISAELGARPMPLSDETAHASACRTCDSLLASRPDPERYAAAVRHRLEKHGPPFLDVESVARTLGTTPRTIGRRLAMEGTSFRALLDEVRMAHAEALLARGHRSITEIGLELGYSDTANFTRAYRRTYGRSPSKRGECA